jgi:hypothetical protein
MTSLIAPARRQHRFGSRVFAAVLGLSVVTLGIVPSRAEAARARTAKAKTLKEKKENQERDSREMEAREAFAAGDYQKALDIYTKLYAIKLHPTFLRNIARCYQNLAEPERAISSFREYLRKAKDVSDDERAEVEGYIKEMEELQKKNEAAAAPPAAPVQPLPAAAPPVAPVEPRQVVIVQQPEPEPAPSPAPFYTRAWFWGVVGVVVVAGTVGGLWAGGVFSAKSNNGCLAGYTCGGAGQ